MPGSNPEYMRTWRAANKLRISEYNKEYAAKNAERIREKRKAHEAVHRDRIREEKKAYYRKNVGKLRLYTKQWVESHKERRKEYNRVYTKRRYESDPEFRLRMLLRNRVNTALKCGSSPQSAIKALGCSVEELRLHLESKFTDGMSWDNRGGWHIDHIVPLSSFDLTDPEQHAKACHFTNLQPLWTADNLSKGARIEHGQ